MSAQVDFVVSVIDQAPSELVKQLDSPPARRLWLLAACIAALLVLTVAISLSAVTGNFRHPSFAGVGSLFFVTILIVLSVRFLAFMIRLLRTGEAHPFAAWIRIMRGQITAFVATAFGAAVICLFLVSISWTKSLLPQLVPFWADRALAHVDQLLFNGHPMPIGGVVTAFVYSLWQAAHLAMILWALHWREGRRKDQVIIAFLLTWSIGMMTAYVMSSAGPIFTGQITQVDRLTRLEADFLWKNYQAGTAALGGGISAFPSMHVAIAVWIALALRERQLGLIGVPFAILTAMGALTLGWHYSMDLLGGVAVAMSAWAAAKVIIGRFQSLALIGPPSAAQATAL